MLNGKVAVVTGASRGIGKAIAIELAKQGAIVVINYNGSREKAEKVKDCIEGNGGTAVCRQCNVADFKECQLFIEGVIEQFGRIDILVNNAGVIKNGLIATMEEKDFDIVLDTNLKGTFHCIRFASRQMIRQKSGKIINISSVAGVFGVSGQTNYSASKAGMIGLTKSVARELARRNITVNAIAPGFIETDMTKDLSKSIKDNAYVQTPLGRFGETEDVAHLAAFLASDKASYITGQVIHVDGGIAM